MLRFQLRTLAPRRTPPNIMDKLSARDYFERRDKRLLCSIRSAFTRQPARYSRAPARALTRAMRVYIMIF
jgi:hypothetical protein